MTEIAKENEAAETTKVRKLQVKFSKERLRSSLNMHLKRRLIPKTLMGYDILLGVVFGKIRHPEKKLEEVIQTSVNVCRLPGSKDTIEDGIYRLMEVCEVVTDVDDGMAELEIIETVVNQLIYDIYKEYCYETTIIILKLEKADETLAQNIVKNMIFKKLVADDSTWECMCEYAVNKLRLLDENIELEDALKIAEDAVPEGMTLEEYVFFMVEEAYKL